MYCQAQDFAKVVYTYTVFHNRGVSMFSKVKNAINNALILLQHLLTSLLQALCSPFQFKVGFQTISTNPYCQKKAQVEPNEWLSSCFFNTFLIKLGYNESNLEI